MALPWGSAVRWRVLTDTKLQLWATAVHPPLLLRRTENRAAGRNPPPGDNPLRTLSRRGPPSAARLRPLVGTRILGHRAVAAHHPEVARGDDDVEGVQRRLVVRVEVGLGQRHAVHRHRAVRALAGDVVARDADHALDEVAVVLREEADGRQGLADDVLRL